MKSMRKTLGFLILSAFAAFALTASAAGPAKIFGLVMAPATVSSSPAALTAKFSNLTPNGNSVINTVILSPPTTAPKFTSVTATFPNGGNQVACPATTVNSLGQTVAVPAGSICVANIPSVMKAGCSPVACNWTMNVSVSFTNTCAVFTWSGQAFAGNSFNGDVFEFKSAPSSLTTTINSGCTAVVTPNPGPNGSMSPNTPQTVALNSQVTFTVTPNTGYHTTAVSGCGVTQPDATNFPTQWKTAAVTGDCTVSATFAINDYVVTAVTSPSTGANGSITPASQGVSYLGSATVFVTPNAHYHVDSVTATANCNGITQDATDPTKWKSGGVTGACTVTASFAIDQVTVSTSSTGSGSISPSSRNVDYGSTTTFTVSPSDATFYATASGCGGSLSGTTYTTGAITAACTVSATFAKKALTITTQPTSAALNKEFEVVVGVAPGPTTITVSAGCTIATPILKSSSDTSQTWGITITEMPAAPGTCVVTFTSSDPNYSPASTTSLKVYKGVLACGDYDSVNGPLDPTYDPDLPSTQSGLGSSYVGAAGWGLRRGPNKDGAECKKINYSCDLDPTTNVASCSWDKAFVPQQQATFKYLFLWDPRAADSSGWTTYRPQVSWGVAAPNATFTLPDWVPLVACKYDLFPLSGDPTLLLPDIPNVAPFTDAANTLPQYQPVPTQKAMVCGAQQGWTAVGPIGSPKIQIWNIIIDEADLKVAGPT